MAFHGKLTLKSATTISLHERFTHLRNIKPIPATGPEPEVRSQIPKPRPASPQEYYVPPSANQNRRENSAPQYHGIFEENSTRYRRQQNSDVRQKTFLQRNPRTIRPHLAFQAALRLKRRSIKQRLGPRPQSFFNNQQNSPYKHRRFYNGFRGRRGGYRGRNRGMNRWTSTHSLASDGMGRGRRRSGNWWGRGQGRRGRYQKPKVSKEELDAQLDSYMANTKTVLDKDLDDYMSQQAQLA